MAASPKSKMCKVITFTGQQLPVFCSVVAVPKNADPKGLSPPFGEVSHHFDWFRMVLSENWPNIITSPCESPCSSIFSQGNPVFFFGSPPQKYGYVQYLWLMVLITIVNGVYKPTYNWGASHCRSPCLLVNHGYPHRIKATECVPIARLVTPSCVPSSLSLRPRMGT